MKYSRYNLILKDIGVLVNTFTGETFKLGKETITLVENGVIPPDKGTYDDFLSAGVIIRDEVDELIIDYMHKKHKFDTGVLSLTILMTERCNLRCTYCFQGGGEIHQTTLTEDSKSRILKFIKNLIGQYKPKALSLVLFGGEPLLGFKENREWLFDIKGLCSENNLSLITSIVTNGLLITLQTLKDLKDLNCQSIQITLDGIKETHDERRIFKNGDGTFDKIINKIKMVRDDDEMPNPIIRINIDKDNSKDVEKLLRYLKEEELDKCLIDFGIIKKTTAACASYQGHCFEDEELANLIDGLWDIMEKLGFQVYCRPQRKFVFCGLYKELSFTISPTGQIYKCWEHVSDPKHLMAEINSFGGVDEWLYPYFDWMAHDPLANDECRNCIYLPICGGGCGSISYSIHGSYHKPGCFKTKGVYEMQIKRLFKDKL